MRLVRVPQLVRRNAHIPGERPQLNTVGSRVPRFPFRNEVIPTLLPKPDVPQLSKTFTFRDAILQLRNSKQEELIYEAEPHRLYFFLCYALAFVLTTYGVSFFLWGRDVAEDARADNEDGLPLAELDRQYYKRMALVGLCTTVPLGIAAFAATVPSRLVRRLYYLPGEVPHIRLVSHPVFPGRPLPVTTVPLSALTRNAKSKVYTGRGFYGAADDKSFCFFLKESGSRLPWIVDRKGFFWVDGRVHDFLFGKESLREAYSGVSWDQRHGLMAAEVKDRQQVLKKEHGRFWRLKGMAEIMKEDVQRVGGKLGLGSSNANPTKKVLGHEFSNVKEKYLVTDAEKARRRDGPAKVSIGGRKR